MTDDLSNSFGRFIKEAEEEDKQASAESNKARGDKIEEKESIGHDCLLYHWKEFLELRHLYIMNQIK